MATRPGAGAARGRGRRVSRWYVAATAGLVLVLAGCGGEEVDASGPIDDVPTTANPDTDTGATDPDPEAPDTDAATSDDTDAATAGADDDGQAGGDDGRIRGTLLRGSDTPDVPVAPVDRGVIVLVPEATAEGFWALAGVDGQAPSPLAAVRASVDADALPDEVTVLPVDETGRFAATGTTSDLGGGVLCVGDTAAGDTPTSPHRLWGCVEVPDDLATAEVVVEVSRVVTLRAADG